MTPSNIRLAQILTHAGILPPFLALAAHLTLAPAWAGAAALSYAAIIVSFVGGVHWGVFLRPSVPVPINLLVTSNAAALAAWALLLVSLWSVPAAALGLSLVLALLLAVDRRLLAAGAIEPWFWTVRRNASLGLGAALVLWSMLY